MVYRRNYKRKRYSRKRKKYSSGKKFGMTKNLNYKGVVFWKEKLAGTFAVAPNTGDTAWTTTIATRLTDLANASVFSSLFDYYKITGVKFTFFPLCSAVPITQASGVTSYWTPQIAYTTDFDGGADWTGWAQAMESNARVRAFTGDKTRSIYYRPKLNTKAYESPSSPADVTTIMPGNRQPWVDMRFPATEYHGLKLAINNPPSTPTDAADLQYVITYYIAFKGHL